MIVVEPATRDLAPPGQDAGSRRLTVRRYYYDLTRIVEPTGLVGGYAATPPLRARIQEMIFRIVISSKVILKIFIGPNFQSCHLEAEVGICFIQNFLVIKQKICV